jgi:hypothetical protein
MLTPFCMSQVAAVWRKVCGVILPGSLASRTAVLSAVLTEAMGLLFHSGVNRNVDNNGARRISRWSLYLQIRPSLLRS